MHRSTTRILTSHTGSLPRPPDLVDLYIRKGQGQNVDAELEAAAHASMQDTIRRQKEAGIDIGNNGEQQREAFFLYVRNRMTGFGGSWTRPPRGDVDRYPIYKATLQQEAARTALVSARDGLPTAICDIAYADPASI